MKSRKFNHWNWEFDFGEGPLSSDSTLPKCYAEVLYDDNDTFYRVILHDEGNLPLVYDYFHDRSGRILEKRALSEDGNIDLIVKYTYDFESGTLTETAWYASSGPATKPHTRRIPDIDSRTG